MKASFPTAIILLIFQIVFHTSGHTQTPLNLTYIYNYDSLIKVNENYLKQDIGKLKLLNVLTLNYQNADPTKGIESGEQAIALAQILNNQLLLAEAYNNKGLNHLVIGDNPTAMELFEKALAINQTLKNNFGIAHNNFNIGNIIINEGDSKKAKEYFEHSLKLFESVPDKAGIAKSYRALASVFLNLYDYPNVLEYSQKAFDISEQLGDKNSMAICLGKKGTVYYIQSDYPTALEYFQKALTLQEQIGNKRGSVHFLGNIGNIYASLSKFNQALEYLQKAYEINAQIGDKSGMASNLSNIGGAYAGLNDYPKALENLEKALAINEQIGDKSGMAVNLSNIGKIYINLFNYPKALEYYQKALAINEQIDDKSLIAEGLCNIGMIYHDVPDSVLLKFGISPAQRIEKVLEYQNKGLQIAREIGDGFRQKYAWLNLSYIYEKQGDYAKAYDAYKAYIVIRDSIESGEIKNKIERKTMQYEFDKRETALKYEKELSEEKFLRTQQELNLKQKDLALSNKEKDLQHLAYLKEKAEKQEKEKQLTLSEKEKQLQSTQLTVLGQEKELQKAQLVTQQKEIETKNAQRNLFIGGTILMLLLASSIFIGLRRTSKEKKRSETLLLNILPAEVAQELKTKGSADAKQFDEVTVMFTDFKGFTQISEKLSPAELVAEIDTCFKTFDHIISRHNIEKIKTIGDAYMCAGGLPVSNKTHAVDVVNAALEIQKFMLEHLRQRKNQGKEIFEIRIGIHTGPVVAGIVGVKKFAYDIWGDTVNIASRMESSGEVGKVNISGSTFELVKDKFNCVHRGKVQAKNKGEIDMYFVS